MPGRDADEGRAAGAAAQRGRRISPHHSPAHKPEREEPDTKNLSQLSDIACLMESDPAALLCAVHPNELPLPKLGSQDPMSSSLPGPPSQNYAEMLASLPVPGSLSIQPLSSDSQPGPSSQMSVLGSQLTQLAVAVSALPTQPPSTVPAMREAAARQLDTHALRTNGLDALNAAAALCAASEPSGSAGVSPNMVPVLALPVRPVLDVPLLSKGYVATQLTLPGAALGKYTGPKSPAKQTVAPHPSVQKVEHKGSRATRRGPMDEMRQLVRILVKLIPNSMDFLSVPEEGGGGNRVSEEQIKDYLRNALGEAPQPSWGLPDGWGGYLSELFTWAAGREVTREQAMRCARRQPGRSWEAVTDEIMRLGVNTFAWTAPLSLANVRSCCSDPGLDVQQISGQLHGTNSRAASALVAAVAIASGDGRKRSASSTVARSEDGGDSVDVSHADVQEVPRKRSKTSADVALIKELDTQDELTCWQIAAAAVQHALQKAGTTPSDQLHELQCVQRSLRALLVPDGSASGSGIVAGSKGLPASLAMAGQEMQHIQVQQSKLLQLLSEGRLGMHPMAHAASASTNQGMRHGMLTAPGGAIASMPMAGMPFLAPAGPLMQQQAVPMAVDGAECADAASKQQGVIKPCAVKASPDDILQAILRSQESQGDDGSKGLEAVDAGAGVDSKPKSGSSFQPYRQPDNGSASATTTKGARHTNGPVPSAAKATSQHNEPEQQQQPHEKRQQAIKADEGTAGSSGSRASHQQQPDELRSILFAAIDSASMAPRTGQAGVGGAIRGATAPMQGVV